MHDFKNDTRFANIQPFKEKVWLSSPTMHGEELRYMQEAYETNWMSTVGANINEIEKMMAEKVGMCHAVALSSGTAALHLAVKLAAERLYNSSTGINTPFGMGCGGALYGKRVFCSDLTFDATVNPVLYEGGEPVFIDSEYETWNMDPEALEKAFHIYPDVKLVVFAHLYGVPGKVKELAEICKRYGALMVEDAAESLGATYKEAQTGSFGDFNAVSFNGNKIITGSSGGMFFTNSLEDANKCRKWSTQSREAAPWYQHEEIGYNYRMSNVIAGVVRGQIGYLEEHIQQKKKIYERYQKGFADLPVSLNPFDKENSEPNYWLTALLIDEEAMASQVRGEREVLWKTQPGRSTPTEILEALEDFHAEGRPIWKPMHMQPIYRNHTFITAGGFRRGSSNAYIPKEPQREVGRDIFRRGLCLPSDIKMDAERQEQIIEIIHRCFK
ncbi:MAG: aminotransferase DegT [Dorea sp.]|jgi:dTDP-4-amino-4,6-dideoxygalactose transaminase|nr:aminotransferase DegT [Dorea sp.]GFI42905.1 putative pyridoxal phosphate-dependent aminotransferase EpsN [Lachnospiraceae bacterium]